MDLCFATCLLHLPAVLASSSAMTTSLPERPGDITVSLQVDDASFVIHRPHEASSGSFAFSSDATLQGHIVGMYTQQVCILLSSRCCNNRPTADH